MRIVLGDLRHNTVGRHSTYMPIAIGYIGSYVQSQPETRDAVITFHADADEMAAVIKRDQPDVVGLSNYVWNAELSAAVGRYCKEHSKNTIVVGGGPEFPKDVHEILDYLNYRSELDFFIHNYEGEIPFFGLLKVIQQNPDLEQIKLAPPPGVASLGPDGAVHQGLDPQRLKNLDAIPSPVLSGMMDKFLDGSFMPFLETTRGCPYACTYCVQGSDWYNKTATFSKERIDAELEYIAERIYQFADIPLALADSNFGMYPKDEDTAERISQLYSRYGWPKAFIVDTGKSQLQRLLRVAKKMGNRISMSISPQSMNLETLQAISRTNLGGSEPESVYSEFKKAGISTHAAIIVPLPNETKTSYIEGLRRLGASDVGQPLAYTTMLLKGTALASKETRTKYGMKSKYRMLPSQFGEYFGKRVFEFDEVCIATNSMTFEEYVECRSVVFAFLVLSNKQFDMFKLHCEEYQVSWFDFLLKFWNQARIEQSAVGKVFSEYETLTRNELFESPHAIRAYVESDVNYQQMLEGELGENIVRKLTPELIFTHFRAMCMLGYSVLEGMFPDRNDELREASKWSLVLRDIVEVLDGSSIDTRQLTLHYDLDDWYANRARKSLRSLRGEVNYSVTADLVGIQKAVDSMKRLYGERRQRWASRLLEAKPVEEMWFTRQSLM